MSLLYWRAKKSYSGGKTLYDYVRKNSTSKRIKNSKKYSEIQIDIKRRRNEYFDMMNDLIDNPPDENTPYISNKEFQNYKNSMMLNALFEKFLPPLMMLYFAVIWHKYLLLVMKPVSKYLILKPNNVFHIRKEFTINH